MNKPRIEGGALDPKWTSGHERTKETIESFVKRVEELTGFKLNQIPDASPEEMLGGSIMATSPYGTLIYLDHSHQDEEGHDFFNRAAMIYRHKNLPAADSDADGLFKKI